MDCKDALWKRSLLKTTHVTRKCLRIWTFQTFLKLQTHFCANQRFTKIAMISGFQSGPLNVTEIQYTQGEFR